MTMVDLAWSSSYVFLPAHHACLLLFSPFYKLKNTIENEISLTTGRSPINRPENDTRLQKVSVNENFLIHCTKVSSKAIY